MDVSTSRQRLRRVLRPSGLSRAIRWRTFYRPFARLPLTPASGLVQLGTDYNGWVVPEHAVGADWVCYCVGTGADVTFDVGLADRFGCQVYAFDPAPEAEAVVAPEAARRERFHFDRLAVADRDGSIRMARSRKPGEMSLSAVDLQASGASIEAPARTLATLMAERGHSRIDLLKLDLEGAEYDLLGAIDLDALGVQVFGIEFHPARRAREALAHVRRLQASGFALVAHKPDNAAAMTFVRTALLATAPERDPAAA